MAEEQTIIQAAEQNAPSAENVQEAVLAEGGKENAVSAGNDSAEKTFTQTELNKIVAERVKAEQKRLEKRFADEKAEAERVAAMTAEEKAKHEREKRETALDAREAELTRRERTSLAKEYLAKKGVPSALAGAVDITDPDGIEASAAAVAKTFAEAVSAEVAKKLAGTPPKKAAVDGSDISKQISDIFGNK